MRSEEVGASPTTQTPREALALFLQEYWSRSARRREPVVWADLADAVLALLPGLCAPTEDEIVRIMDEWVDDLAPLNRAAFKPAARAVAALCGTQAAVLALGRRDESEGGADHA